MTRAVDYWLIKRRWLWVTLRKYEGANGGWWRVLGNGRRALDFKGTRFSLIVEYWGFN